MSTKFHRSAEVSTNSQCCKSTLLGEEENVRSTSATFALSTNSGLRASSTWLTRPPHNGPFSLLKMRAPGYFFLKGILTNPALHYPVSIPEEQMSPRSGHYLYRLFAKPPLFAKYSFNIEKDIHYQIRNCISKQFEYLLSKF